MREISDRICTRSLASRLESGSSIRNAWGWRTIARPIATRWRWPPESCPGFFFSWSSSPSTPATLRTRLSISARASRRSLSPNAWLSYTDMCG